MTKTKIEAVLDAPVDQKRKAIEEIKQESAAEAASNQTKQKERIQAIELEQQVVAEEREEALHRQKRAVSMALKEKMVPGWICYPIHNDRNVGYLCKTGIMIEPFSESITNNTTVTLGNGVSRTIKGVTAKELYELFTKGDK